MLKNLYILHWEENRQTGIKRLTSQGIIPVGNDLDRPGSENDDVLLEQLSLLLMGKVAGLIEDRKPPREIVDEIITEAAEVLAKSYHHTVNI